MTKSATKTASITFHPTAAPLRLGDFRAMNDAVLRSALDIERAPLSEMRPEDKPGVYVLFVNKETPSLRRYGSVITSGSFPIYVGSAKMLPDRLSAHRKTIVSAKGLNVSDFSVGVIYTDSHAMALAVEAILIKELRLAWNERPLSGFGSKEPGAERIAAQRSSGFDCLHQRTWAKTPSATEVATARRALKTYLASGYVRPLWPELAA